MSGGGGGSGSGISSGGGVGCSSGACKCRFDHGRWNIGKINRRRLAFLSQRNRGEVNRHGAIQMPPNTAIVAVADRETV